VFDAWFHAFDELPLTCPYVGAGRARPRRRDQGLRQFLQTVKLERVSVEPVGGRQDGDVETPEASEPPEPSGGDSAVVEDLRAEVGRLKAEVARLQEELRRARRDQHETPPHYL